MSVETAADRAVFVDPGDFGVTATYALQGIGSVPLAGLFDEPAADSFGDGAGGGMASASPSFTCRSADLPGAAHADDMLILPPELGGRSFFVRVIRPDGTGMTVLQLEEADAGEAPSGDWGSLGDAVGPTVDFGSLG